MKKSITYRLIAGSILLFTFAFGVNVILNSSAVDKLCEEAILSQYQIIGQNFQRSLRKVPITQDGFSGGYDIQPLLNKTRNQLLMVTDTTNGGASLVSKEKESLITVSLLGADHETLASTDPSVLNTEIKHHHQAVIAFLNKIEAEKASFYRSNDVYLVKYPSNDDEGHLNATIVISIPIGYVQANKNILIHQDFLSLILILLLGIILLVLICKNIKDADCRHHAFSKTRISLLLFSVILSAQIAFTAVTIITFTDQYLVMNKDKARLLVGLLKDKIELNTSNRGVFYTHLPNTELILKEILADSPELSDISIFDYKWHPLYIATDQKALNCLAATTVQVENIKKTLPEWDPAYNVRLTITNGNDKTIQGYISANISKPALYDRLIEIALDSITILVISILFLVEMMIFIFHIVDEKKDSYSFFDAFKKRLNLNTIKQTIKRITAHNRTSQDQATTAASMEPRPDIHYGLMRPAAFLLLFGYDISMSFLPLHTEKLYSPIFGLSKDVIMGLPISVELFFVGVCILVSGIWLDKRGWHEPFITGLAMAALGTLYSWGAPDVMNFIVSRAITGSGYGLALMASQGFVIEYSDARSKAQGLAYLFAGIYAGSLCGGATGAMLADRYAYSSVFFTGALILFMVIVYSFIFMRDGMRKPGSYKKPSQQTVVVPNKTLTRFLSNRIVIALVFFSSLPAAIAVVGFLNYFSPIYLNRIGASQSTIGRVLMIYGICLIYIGPLVSRYVDASNKKRLYIFIGCALGSIAFLTFNVIEGIIAAAVSMLLLGLSSSFVLASQSAYTLRLKVTEELGAGKSIGIFRSTSRGGQVLGPIVFSWLIVSTNIEQGITYFGLAYFASAILFLVFTVRDQQQMAF